jgi:hypothetical protein
MRYLLFFRYFLRRQIFSGVISLLLIHCCLSDPLYGSVNLVMTLLSFSKSMGTASIKQTNKQTRHPASVHRASTAVAGASSSRSCPTGRSHPRNAFPIARQSSLQEHGHLLRSGQHLLIMLVSPVTMTTSSRWS